MTLTLKAYNDAALSSRATKLSALQRSDGQSGPVDFVIYMGSTVSGKRFRAASDPGTDDIILSIADADTESGQSAAAVKLASSASGLDSAVAGDPLSIGPEILSGAVNAVEIHVRIEADNLVTGTYEDLSLTTNALVESYA